MKQTRKTKIAALAGLALAASVTAGLACWSCYEYIPLGDHDASSLASGTTTIGGTSYGFAEVDVFDPGYYQFQTKRVPAAPWPGSGTCQTVSSGTFTVSTTAVSTFVLVQCTYEDFGSANVWCPTNGAGGIGSGGIATVGKTGACTTYSGCW